MLSIFPRSKRLSTGEAPPEEIDPGADKSWAAKIRSHLVSIWKGYRGVGVETVEVAITGTEDEAVAQGAFVAGLKTLAVPGAGHGGCLLGA